jgi:hypothetical protein
MTTEVRVRPAQLADVSGIMEVEKESWGEQVGSEGMALESIMRERVRICNEGTPPWFWVVERGERIEGHAITQPTALAPEECTGWDHATDQGTLRTTFDPRGKFVHGVTLAVRNEAPPVTADLLVLASHWSRLSTGRTIIYLCARMPGYAEAFAARNVSPEEYWRECRSDGSPKDSFLHLFWNLIDVRPIRLLRNGFPPDRDSGGHGVLCMNDDPVHSVIMNVRRLAAAGFSLSEVSGVY